MRRHSAKSDSGVALISILFIMSLMVVLVVAITLLSRSEFKSADTYHNQLSADNLAAMANNLVISQIRSATSQTGEAWASQPGAVRKYDAKGKFIAGYKLYSDDDMIITDEEEFFDDLPDSDWQEETQHYVDINEPIVFNSKTTFPILDPRADGTVEGFSFTDDVAGTVRSSDESARLPMPTRWIYVLEDGTTGHLDPTTNEFVGFRPDGTPVVPDQDNQIVGRIAFWTDDESSKININTASEPTFWDTPKSVSFEDQWYARAQPVQKEFQRYPGHPATTALSTVLFGGQVERETLAQLDGGNMRQTRSHSPRMMKNREIKEAIYKIIPRVNLGGSESGTRIAEKDDTGIFPDEDHLYASLDEFIFAMPEGSESEREISTIVDQELLERSRFFLTAHSRAPELNLFGLPRISIWPTDGDNKQFSYITPYDKLIRFCSTSPAGDRYFFTRQNADNPYEDWANIPRNQQIYEYLKKLTSRDFPGVGGSFATKFGADHEQILTEIFDYIRSTNLFDDSHPNLYYHNSEWNQNTQFTNGRRYHGDGRENDTGSHQGHGQVAPIRIGDTMGFGRITTISECALIFICCAHPGEDYQTTGQDPQKTGGDRIEDVVVLKNKPPSIEVHYSNFPPLSPAPTQAILDAMKMASIPYPYVEVKDEAGNLVAPDRIEHPGYKPEQWNRALPEWKDWNTSTGYSNPTNLKADEMVIQAAFVPEAFIPGQGWTAIHHRIRMSYRDLDGLEINGQSLGFRDYVVNEQGAIGNGYHGRIWGGSAGFRQTVNNNTLSKPIKIDFSDGKMAFSSTKPVKIEIFCERGAETPTNLVQSISLKFPDADFPTPELIRSGVFGRGGGSRQNSVRFWWSFNERMRGRGDNPGSPWTIQNNNSPETVTRDPRWPQGIHRGGFWREGDVIRSLVPYHGEKGGDTRLVAAKPVIDESVFKPHYAYFDLNTPIDHTLFLPAGAHYYWRFGNADLHKTPDGIYPEFAYKIDTQLTDGRYHFSRFPDYPRGYSTGVDATVASTPINTGDFDNGVSLVGDGAYINNPDGGNRARYRRGMMAFTDGGTPYFDANWVQAMQGPAYFSPNRQISSPVMFGSLPTGVKRNIPWQTLLFRPQPWGHPSNFDRPHPGFEDLKDQYLLDLFWMPVVEPYAISEPFSTAGKINLNYQILPFTNIQRATGLHAVMKAEEMLIVSDDEAAHYKNWDHELADYFVPDVPSNVFLRQLVDVDETLKQFEDRFLNGRIFKSAAEICEVHLVPLQNRTGQTPITLPEPEKNRQIQPQIDSIMKQFWMNHSPTGDNSRERPYSNLYPRLTTKSNIFRVHTRSQVLKKSRDSDPKTFDPEIDTVSGEWRGETLIERYIDPNNENIPDYASDTSTIGRETLDKYYRFRVLHRKRFDG